MDSSPMATYPTWSDASLDDYLRIPEREFPTVLLSDVKNAEELYSDAVELVALVKKKLKSSHVPQNDAKYVMNVCQRFQ